MGRDKLLKKIMLLGIIMLVAGCGKVVTKMEYSIDPGLKNIVDNYYEIEKKGEWEKAYEFRDKAFRRIVSKDFYVTQMESDNSGWQLLSFQIVSAGKNTDSGVILKIKFLEKAPVKYNLSGMNIGGFSITQDTEWLKENDRWYCKDAGSRTHLSLNHALTVEN